jgi:hypothetical protein
MGLVKYLRYGEAHIGGDQITKVEAYQYYVNLCHDHTMLCRS